MARMGRVGGGFLHQKMSPHPCWTYIEESCSRATLARHLCCSPRDGKGVWGARGLPPMLTITGSLAEASCKWWCVHGKQGASYPPSPSHILYIRGNQKVDGDLPVDCELRHVGSVKFLRSQAIRSPPYPKCPGLDAVLKTMPKIFPLIYLMRHWGLKNAWSAVNQLSIFTCILQDHL